MMVEGKGTIEPDAKTLNLVFRDWSRLKTVRPKEGRVKGGGVAQEHKLPLVPIKFEAREFHTSGNLL